MNHFVGVIGVVAALSFCMMGCGQTKSDKKFQPEMSQKAQDDNEVFVVLPYDTTLYWIFKNAVPTKISDKELGDITLVLEQCVAQYNLGKTKEFKALKIKYPDRHLEKKDFIIDLKSYKRQYIAVTNQKGEKEIWMNCFCQTWNVNWKHEVLLVDDGGNCFFNLKINLSTQEYSEFMVNGEA
jgi:hypothetical protein